MCSPVQTLSCDDGDLGLDEDSILPWTEAESRAGTLQDLGAEIVRICMGIFDGLRECDEVRTAIHLGTKLCLEEL